MRPFCSLPLNAKSPMSAIAWLRQLTSGLLVSQQFRVGDSRNRPVTFQLTSRIPTAITAGGTVGSAQTFIICCANSRAAFGDTRPSLRQHFPKPDRRPLPVVRCRNFLRLDD